MDQLREEKASEFAMQSFIPADEFIGEAQSWHESSFLQPEYSTERPGEEYALYCNKRHESFSERGDISVAPLQCPLSLFFMVLTVVTALSRSAFSLLSSMYVSSSNEYISLCMFSIAIWKP